MQKCKNAKMQKCKKAKKQKSKKAPSGCLFAAGEGLSG
jgi:hypothetical protein